jgi:transcriptional regulator with XRE-family HTH domain
VPSLDEVRATLDRAEAELARKPTRSEPKRPARGDAKHRHVHLRAVGTDIEADLPPHPRDLPSQVGVMRWLDAMGVALGDPLTDQVMDAYAVVPTLRGQAGLGTSDTICAMSAAGDLLRETRRRHGLTQAQLAARARTSQAAISRIERGLVSPSVTTLASLLDLMGEELQLAAKRIDYGHDRTLLRQNLAKSVSERVEHGIAFSNFVLRNRGVAARG